MLAESYCFTRSCRWYQGIIRDKHICPAYPDGIPIDINQGEDLHSEPREDQFGTLTYESY